MKNFLSKVVVGGLLLLFTACAHHGGHGGHNHSNCKDGQCPVKKDGTAEDCCGKNSKKVWFVEPTDGATVGKKFTVKFGVKGMDLEPAGNLKDMTGHHHLLVNTGDVAKGDVVPTDAKHLHFGKGQTETSVELPPGQHKLTLQFADGAHRSYGEDMRATITVNVK